MKLNDLLLTESELAVVHGGMPPKAAPGAGVVSHAASEAFSKGAHHNAKAFAGSSTYQQVAAIGAVAVISPQTAAQYVANKVVCAFKGKK